MAGDEHPTAELSAGDTVIFSSRTIPGNEKAVGKIVNAFARAGVEVITDRTHLVHVSGHPRRAELAEVTGRTQLLADRQHEILPLALRAVRQARGSGTVVK